MSRSDDDCDDYAANKVTAPATALTIVASIWVVLLLLSLMFDVWLLASGAARQGRQPLAFSKETQVTVRIALGVVMIVANAAIVHGANQMKRLRSRGWANAACVLAMIPCVGPCFLVGVPLGIWGFAALGDPDVQSAFGDRGLLQEDDWD